MKYRFTKEELQIVVKKSLSTAQVCRELGIRPVGGNYKTLKVKYKEFNIDTTHFTGAAWNQGLRYRQLKKVTPLEDILTNKVIYSGGKLRQRLISEGYKEKKCEKCGLHEWMGKDIPLELNHINGDNMDNNLSNLEIICCNCHAQTDNWRGRNKNSSINKIRAKTPLLNGIEIKNSEPIEVKIKHDKIIKISNCLCCGIIIDKRSKHCKSCTPRDRKVERPPLEQLLKEVNDLGYTATGRKYSVSDNSIRKWIKILQKNELNID